MPHVFICDLRGYLVSGINWTLSTHKLVKFKICLAIEFSICVKEKKKAKQISILVYIKIDKTILGILAQSSNNLKI